MPVRVVSVITRLARGGSERRLYDVLRAIPADHTVVVGAESDPPEVERLAAEHEVITCAELVRSVDGSRDPRALARLVSIMRSLSPDVVHTHQSKAGLLGRLAARGGRVRTVYHSASMASFGPGYAAAESRMFALAERVTAPLVSRYFVVGSDLVERLAANGIARRRLEVVRSSLNLRAFTPPDADAQAALRVRLGVEPGSRVVCYVGSLEERKGVTTLPEIVAAAARSHPITLLVAGDGPAYAELASRASDPGLGIRLQVLGHVDDVAEVMRASDLLVLPSSAEGLPQVLVQAASCGLPFTAYDVDGVRELLALGAVGRVVSAGDRSGLASSITSELAATRSADRAALDPEVWSAWDPEVVAGQYLAAYERDLGHRLVFGPQDRLRD